MQVTSNLPALTTLPSAVQSEQARTGEVTYAKALASRNGISEQSAGLSQLNASHINASQLESTARIADNYSNARRSTDSNNRQQTGESVAYDSTENAFKVLSNVRTEQSTNLRGLSRQSPTSLYQSVQTGQLREDLSSAIGINLFA